MIPAFNLKRDREASKIKKIDINLSISRRQSPNTFPSHALNWFTYNNLCNTRRKTHDRSRRDLLSVLGMVDAIRS